MASDPMLESVRKKLDETDMKISTVSHLLFSYVQAILRLLDDKGITNKEEFDGYLEQCRKELAQMSEHAQFLKTMKDAFPHFKSGDEPSGPKPPPA